LNLNNRNFLIPNKNNYKVNANKIYQNNYFNNNNNDDDKDSNYKLNNNLNYQSFINPFNIIHNEVGTGHADTIPESLSEKLYNSILRISLYPYEATGFFMKFKLNNKEKKYLFTCFHVISDEDIQNQITINISYGKKDNEYHKEIELDKNMRFMKAYENEDVTLIEIIEKDGISERKFLTPDLNYEFGYKRYLNKNFYLAGYPENHSERCISSGRII
jgi:hypothetical protein